MSSAPLPSPGEVFEGRYQIDGLLGEGGFSKVFRAIDLQDGRVVALKILVSDVDPSLSERFQREARVLETLDENHIIRLYSHGQSASGLLYMAFEYVEGQSLFEILRESGAMPPERVARILQQILQALQAAHVQGILHRDIKPNNIMVLGSPEQVKVLDFGIAKSFGEPGQDLTAAGTLIGTPRYMSPEQIRGQQIGPASDIYSLGMMAIELLTGRKALVGKDRLDILQQQMSHTPNQLPSDLGIPSRLRDIVERMTAKDVRIRYASAAGVLRDLNHWNEDADDVDETMLAGNISDVQIVRPTEDATVMERIKTGPNLLGSAPPTSQNFSAPPHTGQAPNPWAPQPAPYVPHHMPQNPSGSGSWPQNPSASGSWPQNPSGSGSWPQPAPQPNPQTPSSSGSWPQNPSASSSGSWSQNLQSSSGNWPQPYALTPTPLVLTTPQKVILGISFFLPGVAHLAFGQTKKGALILLAFVLSLGTGIVLSLAVIFDAYLVLRASKHRQVGEMEFFPDYKAFFN